MLSSENSGNRNRPLNIPYEAKPVRQIEDWYEEDGLIRLKITKFRSKVGRAFCSMLKIPNFFIVNLDEIGSFVWRRCNGKNTIGKILEELKKEYGEEEMEARLYVFLEMLRRNGYVKYE
ncbi:MAG: PqqD family protein [Thermoplasmata archaeon]|nr:PqqD family protein [Thermoplasmata archaeon]